MPSGVRTVGSSWEFMAQFRSQICLRNRNGSMKNAEDTFTVLTLNVSLLKCACRYHSWWATNLPSVQHMP